MYTYCGLNEEQFKALVALTSDIPNIFRAIPEPKESSIVLQKGETQLQPIFA